MASRNPDAIALLKADHRTVETLFEKFESARSADRKAALAQEICTELIIHTMIEEEVFYPALHGRIEDDMLDEAYVEHDGAKMLIAELMACSPEDNFYDAKMTVLSEDIRHHVHEEEKPSDGMFAQARKAGTDLQALGRRLQERKEALKGMFEETGLPAPTTRSMIGAKLDHGQPVPD